jgi:hypothetical protein
MHFQSFLTSIATLLLLGSCSHQPPSQAVPPAGGAAIPYWTADFVFVKNGERERYLRFLEANWVQARRVARSRDVIGSYQILLAADSAQGWEVVLLTEYPDRAAYERREAIFRPILEARGRILIDGKGTRELTDSIINRVVQAYQIGGETGGPR